MGDRGLKKISPYRYPTTALVRKHGPQGYSKYGHHRPWLRDEFDFRCVYCLKREQLRPHLHPLRVANQVRGRARIESFQQRAVRAKQSGNGCPDVDDHRIGRLAVANARDEPFQCGGGQLNLAQQVVIARGWHGDWLSGRERCVVVTERVGVYAIKQIERARHFRCRYMQRDPACHVALIRQTEDAGCVAAHEYGDVCSLECALRHVGLKASGVRTNRHPLGAIYRIVRRIHEQFPLKLAAACELLRDTTSRNVSTVASNVYPR